MVFRSVLRSLLTQAAREALGQGVPQSHEFREPGRSLGCDVGFVFALGTEAAGLEDLLGNPRTLRGNGFRATLGWIEGRRVGLVVSGMGRQAAQRATEALIDGHAPRWVVSAGFSGGLCPGAKIGDIVLAEEVCDCGGNRLPVELKIDRDSARHPRLHLGRILTADRLICLPDEKMAMGRQHEAVAVDMESMAVAQACRHGETPFLAVRIISDDVEEELPAFLDRYARQRSLAGKTGVVLAALLKQPSHLKTMYKLREDSLLLGDRLARFLVSLVREIVPTPGNAETAR
jgi:adenosylhomocysteine nucleosidase